MSKIFTAELEEGRFRKVRDIVVDWYEKNCLENEIESFNYDLSKKEDRLKLFILGVFFNCVFKEKKALKIFSEMERHGYLVFDELDSFESNMKKVLKELEIETGEPWGVLKIQNIIDSIQALKKIFAEEDDVISIFREKGVEGSIYYFYERMSEIKAKLLWICRESREYFQIQDEYCYVPDGHVIKFLYNSGFLRRKGAFSMGECLEISREMSKFLGNKYYDLPCMRYHQKKCAKCEKGKATLCMIECRFNLEDKQDERIKIR